MNTATTRRSDRLADLDERLRHIRDALDLVDEEQLLDAIADDGRGRQLRLILANVRQLAA